MHRRLLRPSSQTRGGLAPLAALSPAQATSAGAASRLPSLRCGQPKTPAGPLRRPPFPPARQRTLAYRPGVQLALFPHSPRGNLPA
eukprot:7094911-Alexandrium_andersonii.AAC.1